MKVLENPEWEHMIAAAEDGMTLATMRDQGFATRAFNGFTRNPGKTSSIASAVFDGEHPAGAISLAFFASAMKMEEAIDRFADQIRTCAAAISAELSVTPGASGKPKRGEIVSISGDREG
jgi:IclR family mhp operon transcriptional activator